MARTRQQRRRLQIRVSLALAATLIVVGFASAVSHSAHGAFGPRQSENRSFGSLANAFLNQQNQFDAHLSYLLGHAGTLSRPIFDARLAQLNSELSTWLGEAHLMGRPDLAHDVNHSLVHLTQSRVGAYATIIDQVARSLALPLSATTAVPLDRTPLTTLSNTQSTWNRARFALTHEPGSVDLSALTNLTGTFLSRFGLGGVDRAPSLALSREVALSAFRVHPATLPAPVGTLILPPVKSVTFGVVLTNRAFCDQLVTLSFTVVPRGHVGSTTRQVMSTTLGPLRSFAFVPRALSTRANERASVTLTVRTPSTEAAPPVTATYQLRMSPAGGG